MAGIFVSYRRDDSRDVAGRLVDRLRQIYSEEQLFLDIDGIPAGANFEAVLDERLKACDVLLVVIGLQWLSAQDAGGARRLDLPDDYVRREIAAALDRDDVRVIPLLVSGAAMPRATELPEDLRRLATRQSFQLRYERFNADANDLIAQISKVVAPARRRRPGKSALVLGALAACLIAGVIIYYMLPQLKSRDPALLPLAIKLCAEASAATARLASTSDRAVWLAARDSFWELYNGPLYTIETAEKKHSPDGTSPLEAAMVRFGRQLKEVGDKPQLPLPGLAQASLDVARACKDTVERM